jgi:hypothetical protein
MREHPTREVLEACLCGRLAGAEFQSVVTHLARGCAECRQVLAPLAEAIFHPGSSAADFPPVADAFYEASVSSACAAALEWAGGLDRESLSAGSEHAELEPAEALLETSHALRHDDPAGMLQLAAVACTVAERLGRGNDRRLVCDLQARAWGELANAFRAADDLARADRAMSRSLERRRKGTGDPLLLARLAELTATLSCARRHFTEAFRLLDLARSLYLRYGEAHDAGRMLIHKGIYLGRASDTEQGLRMLGLGLATLDSARDPRLAFQTLHNILVFRVELGDFAPARQQLAAMAGLYERYAGRIDQVKLLGLEGMIAAGLDEPEAAERSFLRARQEFDALGLGYHAAVISLDLAALRLNQGRTAEVRALVEEMLATFRALGVDREAMAALLMLREAAEQDRTTLEMLRMVAGLLQKLDGSATRRLDPDAH